MSRRPRQARSGRSVHHKPPASAPFEGAVRDVASDGRGVVSGPDGRTVLVAGAWLGETVRVTITGSKGSVAFGRVDAVLEPSPARREPACPHHGFNGQQCGGCPWQFVDYPAQLQAKQNQLARRLRAMGDVQDVLQPPIGAPEEWGYRNRTQLKTDGQQIGYVAAASRQLAPVDDCPVLSAANRAHLSRLRQQLPNADWRPARKHLWRTLDIDDELASVSVDKRSPFRQGNSAQNERMRAWLAHQIQGLDCDGPVLELFAGSGNFTTVLAEHFNAITAVEGDMSAVAALNARALPGVSAMAVDLFDERALDSLAKRQATTRVLVLDPPRDGLKVRLPLLRRLRALEVVIYVSCDGATWQRDVSDFIAGGLVPRQVQLIDLFPQTPHFEVLSVLTRAS